MNLSRNFKTLKGSSLIESIIAIVLISVCSLVALTIYLNVIGQNNPIYFFEAKHKIEVLTNQAQKEQNLEDETYNYSLYSIEKKVFVKRNENVAILNFIVKSGNKKQTIKKLIPIEKTE